MKNDFIRNWFPYAIKEQHSGIPLCRWINSESVRFSDPFFDESIAWCRTKQKAEHSVFHSASELSFLTLAAEQVIPVEPAAIIFHISRCGSTLFTQMLGADERNLVLAEVPLFDEILRLKSEMSEEERHAFLKAAIRLTGQKRFEKEERLIIKTDSWHLFLYEKYRRLFPDTPFILLYRKPEPVLKSHARRPGMHMVFNLIPAELFGISAGENYNPLNGKYEADVLERYYRKILSIAESDPKTILMSYDAGFTDEFFRVCAAVGLPMDETVKTKMRERSLFHSKEPAAVFSGDTNIKLSQQDFGSLIEAYDRLEEKRISVSAD